MSTVRALCGPWSSDAPDHPRGVRRSRDARHERARAERIGSGTHSAPRCTSPAQVASALTLGIRSSSQSSLSCVAFLARRPRGTSDTLDGARHLATPVSDRRFFDAARRLSPLRVAQDATAGGRAWCSVRGGKLDFEGCRWFDHQVVAAVTVRGVSAIDGFFAGSRLGGARVALAEGAVRHRLVAVFAGGCAPGGRLVHFPGAGVALRSAQRWLLNLAAVFQRALVEWRLSDGCRGQSTVRG
jgi:hypothetical protein